MSWFANLFGATSEITSISVGELQDLLTQSSAKDKPFLLDVRGKDEAKQGYIPGVKVVPLNELPRRMGEIPKNRKVVVICRSGRRSGMACSQLMQAGYPDVLNMSGGMIAWARQGLDYKTGR